jgi:hypothetical protein
VSKVGDTTSIYGNLDRKNDDEHGFWRILFLEMTHPNYLTAYRHISKRGQTAFELFPF